MDAWLSTLLLIVFAVHLVAFAVLGMRRRQWYYLALVVTFFLLCASFGLRLAAPDWAVGGVAVFQWSRWAAWVAAAVSLSWTAVRVVRRRRGDD